MNYFVSKLLVAACALLVGASPALAGVLNGKTFYARTDCNTATRWYQGGTWTIAGKDCDVKMTVEKDDGFTYEANGEKVNGYIQESVGQAMIFFEALHGLYIQANVSLDGNTIQTQAITLTTLVTGPNPSALAGKSFFARPDCGLTTYWFQGVVGTYTGRRCEVHMQFTKTGDFDYMADGDKYTGTYRERGQYLDLYFQTLSGRFVTVMRDEMGKRITLPNFDLEAVKP